MGKVKLLALISAVVLLFAVAGPVWADDAAKININKASAEELSQLKGVGEKYAAKIIEFREKNGPFKTPEDITKVPGIGAKTFELNKDRIAVE